MLNKILVTIMIISAIIVTAKSEKVEMDYRINLDKKEKQNEELKKRFENYGAVKIECENTKTPSFVLRDIRKERKYFIVQ